MRRFGRWMAYSIATLSALSLLAIAAIFLASEHILGRKYVPHREPLVPVLATALADVPRRAELYGCQSCHGEGLAGNEMLDDPKVGELLAPNLPALARSRTDQELAAAIRQGIGHDGRSLLVMPSGLFSRLPPDDVSALIAWIRSLPVKETPDSRIKLTSIGRAYVILGDIPRQADLIEEYQRRMPIDLGPKHAFGRRLAATICAECHGPSLEGGTRAHADMNPSFGTKMPETPDLDIVGAYDLAAFTKLLRTGVPPDGRKLGMMASVSRDDFKHFTDEEIAALHAYLQERAQQ